LILGSGLKGSASSYVEFGLRTGSTNSTASYAQNIQRTTYTTLVQNSQSTGAALMGNFNHTTADSTVTSFILQLSSPFEAKATGFSFDTAYDVAPMQIYGQHQVATSYESMWFTVNSGTLSGSISVYGYGV
jgi:hypothetical protein